MGKRGRVLPFAMPTPRDQAERGPDPLPAAGPGNPRPERNEPGRAPESQVPRQAGSAGPAGPAGPRPHPVTWDSRPDADPDRVIEPEAERPGPADARRAPGSPGAPAPGPSQRADIPRRPGPGTGVAPPGRPEHKGSGAVMPRSPAEVGRRATGAPAPRPDPDVPPSWAKVAGTTLQLFLQRRRTRWRVIAGLVAVLVVFAGGGLTAALIRGPAPSARPGHATAPGAAGLAQVRAATAARDQAAAWVAAQVSLSAIVACDPAMCAALQARGFPAGNLMTIGPGTNDPLGSTVIVATAAVRSQFGRRLETVFAPTVIAAFGTGSAQVDVRAYAPGGAAAYLAALRADQLTREALGRTLLRNARVSATPAARAQLGTGQVDARLLATIATLAGGGPVSIVGFSDSGPRASAATPLRAAELATPPGAKSGYLPSVLALLRAQQPPYLATSLRLARVDGQEMVQIEFAAPSPLGLLSG
jgi:hypothetical protein